MVIHRFTQQLSQWTYWILLCLTSPRPQLVSWNCFPKQPFCQKNFRLPRLTLSIFDFWPALWNEKVEWFTTLKYLKCDLMILNRRWKGWGFPKHTWTWATAEIKRTCNLPEAPTTPPNAPHKKKENFWPQQGVCRALALKPCRGRKWSQCGRRHGNVKRPCTGKCSTGKCSTIAGLLRYVGNVSPLPTNVQPDSTRKNEQIWGIRGCIFLNLENSEMCLNAMLPCFMMISWGPAHPSRSSEYLA